MKPLLKLAIVLFTLHSSTTQFLEFIFLRVLTPKNKMRLATLLGLFAFALEAQAGLYTLYLTRHGQFEAYQLDTLTVTFPVTVAPGTPDGHYYYRPYNSGNYNLPDPTFTITNGVASISEIVLGGSPEFGGRLSIVVGPVGYGGPELAVYNYIAGGYWPDFTRDQMDYFDTGPTVVIGGTPSPTPTPTPFANTKCNDDKSGGDQERCPTGRTCDSPAMAKYSVHSMLVSLSVQDTPLRYSPPRGPAINFTVTYNQKESQQPATFNHSNLGPKWTFNWLSYVSDDPAGQLPLTSVYVPGGGAEVYQFNSASQTFSTDPQSHAKLIRGGPGSYEKHFPDGSKQIFDLCDGAVVYPRKFFMTAMVDPAGNSVSIDYDSTFRITTITDALGQETTLAYELANDPRKITKVTDPFGRFATFEYYPDGKLKTITDEIGIQSQFTYQSGTDAINSLTTSYGTTNFVSGVSGTTRWIEATDPLGGKERVEYRDHAPGISATEPSGVVPAGMAAANTNLDVRNSFYWSKKALTMFPPVGGVYDYTKAKITHWLLMSDGNSTSGIAASEKQPLENRLWYTYSDQFDYQHAGASANPSQVARVLDDGTTQLSLYEYNSLGKTTKTTDPVGRVMSYIYDTNNVDLLEIRQTKGTNNELLRKFIYNLQHKPLTDTDAAGQVTTYTYNPKGQMLTRKNAKDETTTYAYGGTAPPGHLESITSPPFDSESAVTRFGYDSFKRVRTVTDSDNYTVTTDYDNLDRPTKITYSDTPQTNQQFFYTQDFGDGRGIQKILELTTSIDRRGLTTTRHYDRNRHMDSITDPLIRTTQYSWCTCGALENITDPRGKKTTFVRDLQGRLTSRVFQDNTFISYFYENTTSRLKSMTDALNQTTSYTYFPDNNTQQIRYTNTQQRTPNVSFTYDPNYNRVVTMFDALATGESGGFGPTTYSYYPVTTPPALGANQLKTVNGPPSDSNNVPIYTITYSYDELGRITGQSVDGVSSGVAFDALGRVSSSDNSLGHFSRTYDGLTPRLQTLTYPNAQTANYSYFDNMKDRRLQTLQNLAAGGVNLSKFDYIPDVEGQILTWTKQLGTTVPPLTGTYGYDLADQLTSATTATLAPPVNYSYDYDSAGNRTTDQVVPGTHSFNDVNQTQDAGYAYDKNGNLVSDGTRSYTWDAANRLIIIEKMVPPAGQPTPTPTISPVPNPPGFNSPPIPAVAPTPFPTPVGPRLVSGTRTIFWYDGLGRRISVLESKATNTTPAGKPIWVPVSSEYYVWSGNTLVKAISGYSAGTKRFFAEGEQINGTNYYYTRDHLGSIREMTDATGALRAQYEYDPYGNRTKLSGDVEADFGFTGYYHHAPSGLNLALYRAYSPTIGRWISRDPLKNAEINQGPNLYRYVQNDPLNRLDPLGLKCVLSSFPLHSVYFGIAQFVYVQGDDGMCPTCPYEEGTMLEFPLSHVMQLLPRFLVGEDRLLATTGTDIREQPVIPSPPDT